MADTTAEDDRTAMDLQHLADTLWRLPRQADHFRNLLDHMLNVKNQEELRRALRAQGQRLFQIL